FFNKGSTFNELKKYEEATECYDKAIALKPDYSLLFYNKAICLIYINKKKNALNNYNKAIKINPTLRNFELEKIISND
ncbi:MAG: tetratricopeptide repeat protein, partial [Nitrosopumilaceae archaeon]|nr:tetratricopeptide repeat protein [Nitrosopumilaceae archaeon]